MVDDFSEHIAQMLKLGKKTIKGSPMLTEETGVVNAKGDKSIGMDVEIERVLIEYIKQNNLPVNIFSEEIGTIEFHPNPSHLISFDPLDGSTNYKIGKGIFPYGLLIACFKGLKPKLKDVIAAGAIEYTQDLVWILKNGKTFDQKNNRVILKKDWPIHHSTPIYLDIYYKEGYRAYDSIIPNFFIRNSGSTVGNLSYVLSNIAAGLGGYCMRPEEIGAVVALIKGAGGVTVNHQGKDLGEEEFSPDKTYQILGGCKNIIDFVVKGLS